MMKSLLVAIIACLLAGADSTYVAPEFLATDPKLPPAYDESKAMRLSLVDAIDLALAHNLNLSIERQQLKATELGETVATWSMYEPSVSTGAVITSKSESWDVSVSEGLPTGGHATIGMSSSRFAGAPSSYSSNLTFSITQPLLRGFSTDLVIPRYEQLTATLATKQERLHAAEQAATLIQQTEAAYWDVVDALYSYNVTLKSQQAAEATMLLAKRQVEAGIGSPADITGAEATYAHRKIEVLSAAATIEQSWDALRTILGLPHDDWNRPLLPTDHPHYDPATTVPSEDAAYQAAVTHRPEIAEMELDREASELALRKAENDELPQIDLSLQGSVYGQDHTYAGALGQLESHADQGWSVGLSFTWTPTGKVRKANREIARLHHQVRATERELKIQGIWSEVRTAVRAQRAATLEVVAASQSRKVATENLDIETRKYQAGSSSNLSIATAQNAVAEAELTELRTVIGQQKATTELLLATGELLASRRVAFKVKGVR